MAILDADKEGFLRSERSLIQTMGRAARNANGQVIMYADTNDRFDDKRQLMKQNVVATIQMEYNEKHGITPKTIQKENS